MPRSESSESTALRLERDTDAVAVIGDRTVARALPVWLRVAPTAAFPSRRWVRVRYRSSFFDDPVRPLIRFETADGRTVVEPMNGAILGIGEWTGPVPDKTMAVSISPVARLGPFDFAIDSVDLVPRRQLLWNAVDFALGRTLRLGAATTPIEDYHGWHSRHVRALDLGGIDRPRTDWQHTPEFLLVLRLAGTGLEDLQATIGSLASQAYKRWQLVAIVDDANDAVIEAYRRMGIDEPRLLRTEGHRPISALASRLNNDDCVAIIEPGDVLADNALAIIAERLAAEPDLILVYGDEDAIARDGTLHSPALKPDWSPVFQRGLPYIGRPSCVRFGTLARSNCNSIGELAAQEQRILGGILDAAPRESIGHLRRILYRRRFEPKRTAAGGVAGSTPALPSIVAGGPEWPEVTIVVPTRDMANLLSECVKGLKEKTEYPHYQVVIVDNGSTERDALALLNELRRTPRFTVISHAGAFNFSAICNAAARTTATPLLVFLNNDVAMIGSDWLKPLARWAMQPTIGAVGAKLLFPSGTVQHAGVVVGLGAIAGHCYRKAPSAARGYLDQLVVPREVTSVTAACMAIERTKFEAVGGFDSENLPVELNDVDLCLRLAERGWTNLWTHQSVLHHQEFGSRRIGLKPSKSYRRERFYFLQRWQHAVRDDPYFHPGLSLFSFQPALA
jgi:O-antigen biosynthesis protein